MTAAGPPDLSTPYAVEPRDVDAYRRDGHALLRGVASADEVAAYAQAIVRAATEQNAEDRPRLERVHARVKPEEFMAGDLHVHGAGVKFDGRLVGSVDPHQP